jgi:Flp pilus assembly protein TadG
MIGRIVTARRRRDERGGSDLVQMVITAPVLLVTILTIFQVGLFLHGRNVAEQAAQEGAKVARSYDGSEAAARRRTKTFLRAVGRTTLKNRMVVVKRDETVELATVTVTGDVKSLVPGIDLKVSETASAPIERPVPAVVE